MSEVVVALTDAELARSLRAGDDRDRSAAGEVSHRHGSAARACAKLCRKDHKAAEELADEAFERTPDPVRPGAGPSVRCSCGRGRHRRLLPPTRAALPRRRP